MALPRCDDAQKALKPKRSTSRTSGSDNVWQILAWLHKVQSDFPRVSSFFLSPVTVIREPSRNDISLEAAMKAKQQIARNTRIEKERERWLWSVVDRKIV